MSIGDLLNFERHSGTIEVAVDGQTLSTYSGLWLRTLHAACRQAIRQADTLEELIGMSVFVRSNGERVTIQSLDRDIASLMSL